MEKTETELESRLEELKVLVERDLGYHRRVRRRRTFSPGTEVQSQVRPGDREKVLEWLFEVREREGGADQLICKPECVMRPVVLFERRCFASSRGPSTPTAPPCRSWTSSSTCAATFSGASCRYRSSADFTASKTPPSPFNGPLNF